MIYFLFGEDTYRSRKKLQEIIAKYKEKNGKSAELEQFDCGTAELIALKPLLNLQSLFIQKRLVSIICPFSSKIDGDDLFSYLLPLQNSQNITVLLWDRSLGEVEKKNAGKLEKIIAKTQEFKFLEPDKLRGWVLSEAKRRSLSISTREVLELLSSDSDLWRISNELDKKEVSKNHEVAPAIPEVSIFTVGENFFQNPRLGAISLLEFFSQGQDDMGLFSYLTNQARTMVAMKAVDEDKKNLPTSLGIHPFVARKAAMLVRGTSRDLLVGKLKNFLHEDWKIKIGLTKPRESLFRIIFPEKGR